MTNLELIVLLDNTYYMTFLDSIENLSKNEKEYKRSSFYKKTRIPLFKLYETYFQYKKSNQGMGDMFGDFIKSIDMDLLMDKISEFIITAEKDDRIKDFIAKVVEFFNVQNMAELQKELSKTIQDLKK